MQANMDVAAAKKTASMLRLRKTLIPIKEYALREGIPENMVKQCGQIGLLQLRKFQGKTLVVDAPLRKTRDNNSDDELVEFTIVKKKTRFLQIAVFLLAACFIASLILNYSLYSNSLDKTGRAYTGTEKGYYDLDRITTNSKELRNKFIASNSQIRHLQNELAVSSLEIESIQTELTKSKENLEAIQAQLTPAKENLRSVQNELIRTSQNLETIQLRNAETAQKLHNEIEKLSPPAPQE
ncbi:MAG: hypothetical protein ACYSRR_06405 [Planctomycetota bacterium]|jgi:peptidoglycan hydrolase CwlO-like protein